MASSLDGRSGVRRLTRAFVLEPRNAARRGDLIRVTGGTLCRRSSRDGKQGLMQAAIIARYGPPDVLKIADIPRPAVAEDQVLIHVHAAGVNPIDWRIRSGSMRFLLPARFPLVLGFDVAGVVDAIGNRVTQFKAGDEVYCLLDGKHGGGYAEYAVASEGVVAAKPAGLSFIEAAGVPLANLTALQALRDLGKIASGQSVLINGASGGVGSFAVQLAKAYGATVTGVCSKRNAGLVQDLGAGEVIDYQERDFTRGHQQFDIIFDAVGKSSFWACRRVLRPEGRYISTLPTPGNVLASLLTWPFAGRRCRMVLARPNGDDLRLVKKFIEEGSLRVVIDRVFPLHEASQAHEVSQAKHARGKLVLRVLDEATREGESVLASHRR